MVLLHPFVGSRCNNTICGAPKCTVARTSHGTALLLPPSGQDPDVDDRSEYGHGQAGCTDPDPCHLKFPAVVLVLAVHTPLPFSGVVPAHDLRCSLVGCGRRSHVAWPLSTGGPPGAGLACKQGCSCGERFSTKILWRVASFGCVITGWCNFVRILGHFGGLPIF